MVQASNAHLENANAAHLLLEGLERFWRNYLIELKRCREEFSNEAIHDLRVATRRLISIIRLLHSIQPRPRLQKVIRTLKSQLDELDDLRDIQVILAEVSESMHELPELQVFQKRQRRLEDKLIHNVRKLVKKFNSDELSRRIHKTHNSIQAEQSEELKSDVLQAVDDAFMLARQRLRLVDFARPATIHRVRVAFKSFRYMVEIVHPLLMNFPEMNLKSMHEYQSLMGDVQDAEVFLQNLADFSEHVSLPTHEASQHYYERRHAEAISAYAKNMDTLHLFWRPSPEQPFPWEKS